MLVVKHNVLNFESVMCLFSKVNHEALDMVQPESMDFKNLNGKLYIIVLNVLDSWLET